MSLSSVMSSAILTSKLEELHRETKKLDAAVQRLQHGKNGLDLNPIDGWVKSIVESYIAILYALPHIPGTPDIGQHAIDQFNHFVRQQEALAKVRRTTFAAVDQVNARQQKLAATQRRTP